MNKYKVLTYINDNYDVPSNNDCGHLTERGIIINLRSRIKHIGEHKALSSYGRRLVDLSTWCHAQGIGGYLRYLESST